MILPAGLVAALRSSLMASRRGTASTRCCGGRPGPRGGRLAAEPWRLDLRPSSARRRCSTSCRPAVLIDGRRRGARAVEGNGHAAPGPIDGTSAVLFARTAIRKDRAAAHPALDGCPDAGGRARRRARRSSCCSACSGEEAERLLHGDPRPAAGGDQLEDGGRARAAERIREVVRSSRRPASASCTTEEEGTRAQVQADQDA